MSSSLLYRLACACALATAPASVFAVDGVVLINQASVATGDITSGDTPGFPVTISQPGSYRLSGNLTVPDANTTAIEITSSFVTLDLNGFSILGPTVCTGTPVTSCSPAGSGIGIFGQAEASAVRILNGSVHGMGQVGVRLDGPGSVVDRVNSTGNASFGIIATGGIVTASLASDNGQGGIDSVTAMDSIADFNAGTGIEVNSGVALRNSANNNTFSGYSEGKSTLLYDHANANAQFGVTAGCTSFIFGNALIANGGLIQDFSTPAMPCGIAENSPTQ